MARRPGPRWPVVVGLTAGLLVSLWPASAHAAGPVAADRPNGPTVLCALSDSRLAGLTGLAVDGQGTRWAVAGSGATVRVYPLGADCSVRSEVVIGVDPTDLRALAIGPDGTFWVADIGDPARNRATVAMITFGGPDRTAVVRRLRYPDGPHPAEAMVLGTFATPLIVTAERGAAGVYRPGRPLTGPPGAADEVVPLSRVGPVSLPGAGASAVVTGGTSSADGTVAALRTGSDAWLFAAPDGDLAAALTRPPVRVPLGGPAGAGTGTGGAVAFDPAGDLLAATTGAGGTPSLVEVPGAAALAGDGPGPPAGAGGSASTWAAAPGAGDSAPAPRAATSPVRRRLLFAAALALLLVAGVVVAVGMRASRRRVREWPVPADGPARATPTGPGWPGPAGPSVPGPWPGTPAGRRPPGPDDGRWRR